VSSVDEPGGRNGDTRAAGTSVVDGPPPRGRGGHRSVAGRLVERSAEPREDSRSRRLLKSALGALGIAVGAAVVLGLLIAYLTRGVGDDPAASDAKGPSLTIPTAGTASSPVPPDWVEQTSNRGLVFRAPPGWTQRTDALVDFRVAPSATGGPGVEQLGVGISPQTDPEQAATSYAQNTYSAQSGFQQQPSVAQTGARGEPGRQLVLSYDRDGTPVTVVVRALPTNRGVVLVVTRAASSDEGRAAQLASATDASLRLS
jgi:hypothetical protein